MAFAFVLATPEVAKGESHEEAEADEGEDGQVDNVEGAVAVGVVYEHGAAAADDEDDDAREVEVAEQFVGA